MYPFSPSFGVLPRGQRNLSLSVSGVVDGQALQAFDNKTLRLCFDRLVQRSCPSSAESRAFNDKVQGPLSLSAQAGRIRRPAIQMFLSRIVSG